MTQHGPAAWSTQENIMRSGTIRLPGRGYTEMTAHRGAGCLACENTAVLFTASEKTQKKEPEKSTGVLA